MNASRIKFLDNTAHLFSRRYGRDVNNDKTRAINENLVGYTSVLLDWRQQELRNNEIKNKDTDNDDELKLTSFLPGKLDVPSKETSMSKT